MAAAATPTCARIRAGPLRSSKVTQTAQSQNHSGAAAARAGIAGSAIGTA
jgi:hypothetical protein